MRFKKECVCFFLLMIMTVMPSSMSFAGEETTGDYVRGMGSKFGRGIGNILVSPTEIGCGIHDEVKTRGAIGSVTGFGLGTALFVRRAFVGVNEAITFVIPMEATLPPPCFMKKDTEAAAAA